MNVVSVCLLFENIEGAGRRDTRVWRLIMCINPVVRLLTCVLYLVLRYCVHLLFVS